MRARGAAAVALVVLASILLGAAPANAFWTVGTSAASSGVAKAATVLQGATPTATVRNSAVTLSWAASTLSTGRAVTGYTITRYNSSNVAQTVSSGCSGTVATTSCTESAVAAGLWTYTVTPRFSTNWAGAASAKSAVVTTETTSPVNVLSSAAVSGGSFLSGATLYYRGAAAGSTTIVNALTDSGSGPVSSTTGSISGSAASRFTHAASTVSTPKAGPFVSGTIGWSAGTSTAAAAVSVTGADANNNTATTSVALTVDNTSPTGGAVGYTSGYTKASTVAVTLGALTESGSGVATRLLQRSAATLSGNACGSYGAFATVVANASGTQTVGITTGYCYRFQYVVADNVGNLLTSTSTGVVKARDYAAIVAASAPLNYYRLDDAAASTVIADSAAARNNGSWGGSATRGVAGAIYGDSSTAVAFDGYDDFGSVTRQISGDFSIEFWFASTQGLGTGSNWYEGAGLVDAEYPGTANDFGVTLLADGRVAAGVGNPDTTALSAAGFNDGAWHHVVMTRTQSTGVVRLYVDGTLQSTVTSSNRSALTATATITFGRLQTYTNFFAGSLDEIALYSTVLPEAQVKNHNLSGRQ